MALKKLDAAANNFVVRMYREFLPRDGPHSALANALGETIREFDVRDLAALQLIAWAVDAVVGFPEPARIDAIAADVWRECGYAEDDDDDEDDEDDDENGAEVSRPRAKPRARGRGAGKTIRGVRYRGAKRDRSADPYWAPTPENIRRAVEEGRLTAVDIAFASFLYQHIRRSERYKDKGRRITLRELAGKLHKTERTARRSISRMVRGGELVVVRPGTGNRNGAIYRFPPRTVESPAGEIEI